MRFIACALLIIVTTHTTTACTPGEEQQDGINSCSCLGNDRGWVCTPNVRFLLSNSSIESHRDQHLVKESEDSCEPGKYFKTFCNLCYCRADGKISNSACTKQPCLTKVWNKDGTLKIHEDITDRILMRKERSIRKKKTTCGRKHCDNNNMNNEIPEGFVPEHRHPSFIHNRIAVDGRCRPGVIFKNGYNHCICGPEGTVAESRCTTCNCKSAI